MMSLLRRTRSLSQAALTSLILSAASGRAVAEDVDLSPAVWGEGERARALEANATFGGPNRAVTGRAVITGTTGPPAIRAAVEALRRGGTAVDAALTVALTQVSLAGGAWVSYAGILTMVVYDAETGEVHALNAGYDTVRGEDDPLTIPPRQSGRTALVPGFMAGVEAAHRRFGKLPFAALFTPAIHFAEEGFPLTAIHVSMLATRKETLSRLAETRAVFTKSDGTFVGSGDRFRQPALAATLRRVAAEGAAYMYEGDWAERFVAAVRSDGGKMTREDLAAYRARWSAALRVPYRGVDVCVPALPAQGGATLFEALRLAHLADLTGRGHYAESPESFYWLHQITSLFALNFVAPEVGAAMIGGADASLEARATEAHADELWELVNDGRCLWMRVPPPRDSKHSDGVVVVDAAGNVAALCHSINTSSWGETGIFVDGVSIPDSASFQQELVDRTGPGRRLPDPTEPLIVLEDGAPIAALSSIGGGLHQATMSVLLNLIDEEMSIDAAIFAPTMHLPAFSGLGGSRPQVFEGDFAPELLEQVEELGLPVVVFESVTEGVAARGYVVGATIDRETGRSTAIGTTILNGRAMTTE